MRKIYIVIFNFLNALVLTSSCLASCGSKTKKTFTNQFSSEYYKNPVEEKPYSRRPPMPYVLEKMLNFNLNSLDVTIFKQLAYEMIDSDKRLNSWYIELTDKIKTKLVDKVFQEIISEKHNTIEMSVLKEFTYKMFDFNFELINKNQQLKALIKLKEWNEINDVFNNEIIDDTTSKLSKLGLENVEKYYKHFIKERSINFVIDYGSKNFYDDISYTKKILLEDMRENKKDYKFSINECFDYYSVKKQLQKHFNNFIGKNRNFTSIYNDLRNRISLNVTEDFVEKSDLSFPQKQKTQVKFENNKTYQTFIEIRDRNDFSECLEIEFQVKDFDLEDTNDFDLSYFATIDFKEAIVKSKTSEKIDSYFGNLKNQINEKIIDTTFEKIMGSKSIYSEKFWPLKELTSKILVINSELKNRNQELVTTIKLNDWHIIEIAVENNLISNSPIKRLNTVKSEDIKKYYEHIKNKESSFTLEFADQTYKNRMDEVKSKIKQDNNKKNYDIHCSDSEFNFTFVASKLKEYLNKLLPGNSDIDIEIVDIENYSDLENNSLLQKVDFKFDKQYKAVVKLTDLNNYSEDISIKFQVRNQIYKNMNDFDLIYFETIPFRNSIPNNKSSKKRVPISII